MSGELTPPTPNALRCELLRDAGQPVDIQDSPGGGGSESGNHLIFDFGNADFGLRKCRSPLPGGPGIGPAVLVRQVLAVGGNGILGHVAETGCPKNGIPTSNSGLSEVNSCLGCEGLCPGRP